MLRESANGRGFPANRPEGGPVAGARRRSLLDGQRRAGVVAVAMGAARRYRERVQRRFTEAVPRVNEQTARPVHVRTVPARLVLVCVGWCAVACAFVGVFVPGMPTTVFVLIAGYCFARSSPRFAAWLANHRWFGPTVRRFEQQGGMSASAKRGALTAMWIAVLVSSALLLTASRLAAVATLTAGVVGTMAILLVVRTVPE